MENIANHHNTDWLGFPEKGAVRGKRESGGYGRIPKSFKGKKRKEGIKIGSCRIHPRESMDQRPLRGRSTRPEGKKVKEGKGSKHWFTRDQSRNLAARQVPRAGGVGRERDGWYYPHSRSAGGGK